MTREETIVREELKQLVDDKINEVFIEYWGKMGIETGDIMPLQGFELDELEDKLTDFIIMIAEQNM